MRRLSPGLLAFVSTCALAAPSFAQQQPNPPANVCVELTSFLDQAQKAAAGAPPAQAPGKAPAQQQAAKPAEQQQASGQQASPPGQSQGGGGGTAVEQADRTGAPRPSGQDQPQRSSGMSGPVTDHGPGAAGPQGDAQERAKSAAPNPKPDGQPQQAQAQTQKPPEPKAPPPSPQAVEKARQSAGANDLEGCSGAVRDMRLAGVALPGPLIALAALKPELRAMAPQGPAPGIPPIPSSGVQPQDGAPPASGAAAQQPPQPQR